MNEFIDFAERVKREVKFDEAAQFYGLTFNQRGYASCPFHAEKTPSLKVKGNKLHCFGCGYDNDVIGFVKDYFKLDFNSAIRKLNSDFALNLPLDRKPTLREQREAEQKQRELSVQREAERRSKAYDLEQINRLLHYNSWLGKQKQTEVVLFDLAFVGRLLDQHIGKHITFDALALIEALLSKHDNADTFKWFWGDEDTEFPSYVEFYAVLFDGLIL